MDGHGRPTVLPPERTGVTDRSPAVAVVDRDGYVRSWSRGAEGLLGWTAREVVDRPLADLLVAEHTLRHRDGRPLRLDLRLCPLRDTERDAGHLLSIREPAARTAAGDDRFVRWLFDQQSTVLVVLDREGRILSVNHRALRMAGRPDPAGMRGLRTTDVLRGRVFEDIERRILRVARTGAADFLEKIVRLPGEASAHAWAVDLFPLKDAAGDVRAVGLAASDYSEQYGTRERLLLLGEARARIGTGLDVAGTSRELVAVAVPRFADHAGVELFEPVLRGEPPAPDSARPDALRRVAFQDSAVPPPVDGAGTLDGAGAEPDSGAGAGTAAEVGAGSGAGAGGAGSEGRSAAWSAAVARCLTEGRAVLHTYGDGDGKGDGNGNGEGDRDRDRDGEGRGTLVAVPVLARGTPLGAALFGRGPTARTPFEPDDLVVAEDLVARFAVCLDNARRYTRERGVALTLQRAMLPPGAPVHTAAETATRYLPAGTGSEVGGDWFDVIPLPGARLGLVVGDVVGHGIHASATMGRLRTAVRTLADIDLPPDELLTHLDDIVTRAAGEAEDDDAGAVPGDFCATCLYAVYDPVSGTCCVARAGHPPPVLVRPDGTGQVVDVPPGPPLGLGSLPFEAVEFATPPGSLLALFTDGLITSRDTDLDERLAELCRVLTRPAPSLDALSGAVVDSMCTGRRVDDAALLLVRPRLLGRDEVADWDVPREAAAVAALRRQVSDRLTAWGLGESGFVTELVVSELVTNAIKYGTGPVRLRLIRDRSLICEVSDESGTAPRLRRARDFDEGGRGLFLVARLTRRWGTRYTASGKTIWAEQALD